MSASATVVPDIANARAAATCRLCTTVMSGFCVTDVGTLLCDSPTPAMSASPRPRDRARSALVTTRAPAPSDSSEQSSSRNGLVIILEAWWSASVIGLPYIRACGLRLACARHVTATWPSCSLVVPYSYMCRWAACANHCAAPTLPNGTSNSSTVDMIGSTTPRPAEIRSPEYPRRPPGMRTHDATPASIARQAFWIEESRLAPPRCAVGAKATSRKPRLTMKSSAQRPALALGSTPSTSAGVSPASASAASEASRCNSSVDLSVPRVYAVLPMPAIAHDLARLTGRLPRPGATDPPPRNVPRSGRR